MASITIPGSGGTPLVFSVTGTSTTNYAVAFENAVNAANTANNLMVNGLSDNTSSGTGSVVLNEIFSNSSGDGTYTLTTGGEYTLAFVGDTTTLNGSTTGDDTVVAAGAVTYNQVGDNANVDFIAGDNVFNGIGVETATITGGAGHDTINTGLGSSTVFSGAGSTLINLNGTDVAYLGDGHATVNADGLADTVATGANGQTILGGSGLIGSGPTATLTVSIADNGVSSGPTGDVVVAGDGITTVFDSVGGSSIFGGAGSLTFVGTGNTSGVADQVLTGTGTTAIFGNDGANIDFASAPGGGGLTVTAGLGNETLNGANAGNFDFFADTTSAATSGSLLVSGGTGSDYFSTGAGTETIVAGMGAHNDVFNLNTVESGSANITIYDFGASDSVSLTSDADRTAAMNGTVSGGNYTITLSDSTTVTFENVTTLTGHII